MRLVETGSFFPALVLWTVYLEQRVLDSSHTPPTWLLPMAVLMSVAAYGQIALVDRGKKKQGKQVSTVRTALSQFVEEGTALQGQFFQREEDAPRVIEAVNSWAERVELFLLENLNDGYVARFRNGANLPMGSYYSPYLASQEERGTYGGLRVRLARLGEFIAEI